MTRYTANCFGYFLKTSPRGWKADPTSRQITELIYQRLDLCLPESLHLMGLGRWYAFSLLGPAARWMLPFLQLQTLPCCTEELQMLLLGILSKAYSCMAPRDPCTAQLIEQMGWGRYASLTKHICLNTGRMKTQHWLLVHNLKSSEVWNQGNECCACHGVIHKYIKTPFFIRPWFLCTLASLKTHRKHPGCSYE